MRAFTSMKNANYLLDAHEIVTLRHFSIKIARNSTFHFTIESGSMSVSELEYNQSLCISVSLLNSLSLNGKRTQGNLTNFKCDRTRNQTTQEHIAM